MDKKAGVYLHIPFCKRKCHYCAFISYCETEKIEAYVSSLCKEIAQRGDGSEVSTVYFGGGTPSLLTANQVGKVLAAVRRAHKVTEDAEITIEVNPESVTEEFARACLCEGVNRISVGVQSFSDEVLKNAGRLHDGKTAQNAIETLQKAGFSNLSADFIIGLPSQTREQLLCDIRKSIEYQIPHLSVYGLSVEEGTPFFQSGVKADDDEEAVRYEAVSDLLRRNGYSRYEISNFSKEGRESRHNVKYWFGVPYYGYGVAAHSFVNGTRIENTESLDEYLLGRYERTRTAQTESDRKEEAVLFPLRTKWGVDIAEYAIRFGEDLTVSKAKELRELSDFLQVKDGKLLLTDKGYYVQDAVLLRIL